MTATIEQRIVMCEQGSAEWMQCRTGCVTASRVADAISKLKRIKEESAARRNLRYEIAGERLTGSMSEHYVSSYMQAGTEKEPVAREEYEQRFGAVKKVGFVYHPTIKWAGASPDGLVHDDGMIEIKCPKVETHLQYLAEDTIPEDYLPQMLWQLACEDTRLWNDFVSFCPMMPDEYQIFRKRLDRTEEVQKVIAAMELEVIQFLADVEKLLEELKSKSGAR